MDRSAFIKRWRVHLAGLALYGTATEAKEGPLVRAANALEIPREVEALLGMMYDSIQPKVPANGQQVKR